jgi:hypothetical protein
MVNPYVIADGACFTGDNAGAMIDKEMRPHARAGLAEDLTEESSRRPEVGSSKSF